MPEKCKTKITRKLLRVLGAQASCLPLSFEAPCRRDACAPRVLFFSLAFSKNEFSRAALQRKTVVTLIAHRVTVNSCRRERFAVDLFDVDHKLVLRADQIRAFFGS